MNLAQIGFLATGSELTSGEVLNSNTPQLAKILTNHGAHLGMHLICDDCLHTIEQALRFLMQHHKAIIITGGLGPTSDDCTREMIAKIAQRPLVFSTAAWDAIVQRLQTRYAHIPESNRKQAFFPEGSTLFENPHGTAWAFHLATETHDFFALPGPPQECLPLFEQAVLPSLGNIGYFSDFQLLTWRLTGVSEAWIAEKLDEFAHPLGLQFAYRAHKPYVDVKLWISRMHPQHPEIAERISKILKAFQQPNNTSEDSK